MSLVSEAPLADEEDYEGPPWMDTYEGPCEDCGKEDADRIFSHLDGRRFGLCGLCFWHADHEPDYLAHLPCCCVAPEPRTGRCDRCERPLPDVPPPADEEEEEEVPGYDRRDPSAYATPEWEPDP